MSEDNPQFRITPWPDHRLEGGWQLPLEYAIDSTGRHLIPVGVEAGPAPRSPVEENYLRLIEVDLDDAHAIAKAASRYGLLGIAHQRSACIRDLKPYLKVQPPRLSRPRDAPPPEVSAVLRMWSLVEPAPGVGESIESWRFGVKALRDLVTAWRVERGEVNTSKADWELVDPQYVDTRDGAAVFLAHGTPAALMPFHPRFVLASVRDKTSVPRGTWLVGGNVGRFPVSCLELFNHVAERASYRVCANRTCGRLFVRQEGLAKHEQHRLKGVVFCSRRCANAETQRRFRHRKAFGAHVNRKEQDDG